MSEYDIVVISTLRIKKLRYDGRRNCIYKNLIIKLNKQNANVLRELIELMEHFGWNILIFYFVPKLSKSIKHINQECGCHTYVCYNLF